MSETWIKLFRKFKEWGWYKNSKVKDLFLEILLTANYDDKPWQKIIVKRGQLVTSINHLVEETGLSEQNVRTALTNLELTNELTIHTTSQYTLITVNKYNDYQELTNKLTNDQQTTNKQLTTTKEYKEVNNNIYAEQFLLKWNEVYGTKYASTKQIDKPLTEWLKSYSIEDICKAIENIKYDSYWKDKDIDPLWLLRFKDKSGEVDRIGKMLNIVKPLETIRL